MKTRIELRELLASQTGLQNLYFQSPETVKMKYPCIVYGFNGLDSKFADDEKYIKRKKYTITIIDKDPDSVYPDKLVELPYCSFDRSYTADNLNHWVYTIYF